MAGKFHAVSIRHSAAGCNAVKLLDKVRFLSNEAPLTPLSNCNTPQSCRCRYQHHADRREGPRRDRDVGLPGVMWFENERRTTAGGRRANDF